MEQQANHVAVPRRIEQVEEGARMRERLFSNVYTALTRSLLTKQTLLIVGSRPTKCMAQFKTLNCYPPFYWWVLINW